MTKIQTGQSGEKLAAAFLKNQGFKILETNFRSKFGEVDIVAIDQDTLVFVEVKTRYSQKYGLPEEAVNWRKLSHIEKVVQFYRAARTNLPEGDRVDVVAIELENNGEVKRIELIKNVTG